MIKSACHDDQAENYDKKIQEDSLDKFNYIRENYFELHDRLIELLELKENDHILDIGIGTGLLEEKIDVKCSISGIDISEKMLKITEDKKMNIELKPGSFSEIPYPDNTFNKIYSCFAFHHLDTNEKMKAFKEMERVLQNNGKIILGDFMYENEDALERLKNKFYKENRADMISEMEEEYFTDIEWLMDAFNTENFTIRKEQISTISWIVEIQF